MVKTIILQSTVSFFQLNVYVYMHNITIQTYPNTFNHFYINTPIECLLLIPNNRLKIVIK